MNINVHSMSLFSRSNSGSYPKWPVVTSHNFRCRWTRSQCQRRQYVHHQLCRAAPISQNLEEEVVEELKPDQAFQELKAACNIQAELELQNSSHGNGLFATQAFASGEVLLRVPRSLCLIVDYSDIGEISVPEAPLPRLRAGVEKQEDLPWDLLLGLALVDGVDGQAGPFWEGYCNSILPQPEQLTIPFCLPEAILLELQHPAIIAGARIHKERLRTFAPGLSNPPSESSPSWLEWGFACVRSRAFLIGNQIFAFVPFLDVANHASEPNADFRTREDGDIEVVALKDIKTGEEVTVSYSGPKGFTNQRMMAQYGFVPTGNPSNRIELKLEEEGEEGEASTSSSPFAESASERSQSLSMSRLQMVMGDGFFAEMASGKDPYLYAAAKSLPLVDEEWPASAQEQLLADALKTKCQEHIRECRTSLEEDEQLLKKLEKLPATRMVACLRYRIEYKKVLKAVMSMLQGYCRSLENDLKAVENTAS